MHTGRSSILVAAAWVMGTLASYTLIAIATREVSAHVGTFQILAIRSAVGLLFVSALIHRIGWQPILSGNMRVHVIRNAANFCGQMGWFYAIAVMPLVAVIAIEFTIPLWTTILAAALLGERITVPRVAAVLVGLSGVLVILRPGSELLNPAAFGVLGGTIGYALSYTLTKKLTATDTSLGILFWMVLMQLPLGLVPALFAWVNPTPVEWGWLLVIGVGALTAHYCMIRAFLLADASVVVPMDFLRLPLMGVIGLLLYNEHPDVFLLIGSVLIVAGNLTNLQAERRAGDTGR
ncbi:MAG: DMT family transporter [Gammaproteobacteria bacterium]|nr:DMT family transporter [Gammaproteobacteria bacterium]